MSELDPHIHAPARLRLCAMLNAVDELEFVTAREALEISDSLLSRHLAGLGDTGYVTSRKAMRSGRRTTWLKLTRKGRRAYESHIQALRDIIEPAAAPAQAHPNAQTA